MEVKGESNADWRVTVVGAQDVRRAAVSVARVLSVPLDDARVLLKSGEFVLPLNLDATQAAEVASGLKNAGVRCHAHAAAHVPTAPCDRHRHLTNDGQCRGCQAWICVVDRAAAQGRPLCHECAEAERRRRTFKGLRVSVLLAILAGVLVWAWSVEARRQARREWARPLQVAFVLLPSTDVDSGLLDAIDASAQRLEAHMRDEYARFGGQIDPFEVSVLRGSLPDMPLPELKSDAFLDRASFTFDMWRYAAAVDDSLTRPASSYDARIYVVVTPAQGRSPRIFEGIAAQDAEFGVVKIELSDDTVELATITAMHESLHTVGATDKYDLETGRARFPEGYAEPDRDYPQRWMELMAHDIPISPQTGRLPNRIEDVRVGEKTAREIGWTQ